MKSFILFTCILLSSLTAFSQVEGASQNLAETQKVLLDGEFSFVFQQNEYYIRLAPADGTYEELDSQGAIIGQGLFNHADISTITPETTSPNGIMKTEMKIKVLSNTTSTITIEVTAKNGDIGVFEIQRV